MMNRNIVRNVTDPGKNNVYRTSLSFQLGDKMLWFCSKRHPVIVQSATWMASAGSEDEDDSELVYMYLNIKPAVIFRRNFLLASSGCVKYNK